MTHQPRITRRTLATLAVTLLLSLALITPVTLAAGEHPADPSNGRLPSQAADQAVTMVNEKVVSQGGRFHELQDSRVAPEDSLRSASTALTGDLRIDALISGYQWSSPTVTYSFYSKTVFNGVYYGTQSGVGEVSAGVKTNVRQIMDWYGTLMNIDFVEVQETTSNIGLIRFLLSNGPGYAYSYYPSNSDMFSVAGDVHLNPSYDRLGDTNGFQHPAGMHGYVSIVHEIGHSLGLKHPFDSSPVLPKAEDNDSHTVMSYTWNGSAPGTPMAYDIMALQHIYGARTRNAGDDSYLFASRGPDQYSLGGQQYLVTPYYTKQAIWDSAGFNTLDFSSLPANSGGYRLDLNGTGWLTAGNQYASTYFGNGTALAAPVVAAAVVNSTSSDTFYANPSPNVFKGYVPGRTTGSDVIYDAGGSDTIDLSGYASTQVTRTQSGYDLVLGLGSGATVTLKQYYQGRQPRIEFSESPAPNSPPVAAISASPTTGVAPLVVAFNGFASSDPDGTIVSYAWSFGDGATATGSTASHSYSTPGSYTAVLTVTDNLGAAATASTAIAVQQQQTASKVAHIESIAITIVPGARNGKVAQALVTLRDDDGAPVPGATVTGKWSGVVNGTSTGATGSAGQTTLSSKSFSKSGTVNFAVTAVVPPTGYSYDPSKNSTTSASAIVPK